MDQATDCKTRPEQSRRVNKTSEKAHKVDTVQTPTETGPELFTTGDLADAMNHRGYTCSRDTVDHFIKT